MKVLYLPLNFGSVIQEGVYDAFRDAGADLEIFDYFDHYHANKNLKSIRANLVQKAKAVQPDLVHMQIQHTVIIDPSSVLAIKQALPNTKIVNWTGDVRSYVPTQFLAMSRVSDYNLISSTGQLDMFKKHIPNIGYWQIGYNPKWFYPQTEPKKSYDFDVVFIANVNSKENYPGHAARVQTVRLLQKTFGSRFGLFGSGWTRDIKTQGPVDQNHAVHAYHRGFCSLSISHFNDLNHYFSDRLLMCMASGRPTVSWDFPGYNSYFTNMGDLAIANSPEDVVAKIKYLLNHPDQANFMGHSGASKVFAEHTYLSRVNGLFKITGLK